MTYRINLSKITARTAGELCSIVNRRLIHLLAMHPFVTDSGKRAGIAHEQKWFRRRVYTEIDGNVVAYRVENIPMTPEQRRSMINYK